MLLQGMMQLPGRDTSVGVKTEKIFFFFCFVLAKTEKRCIL